MLFFYKKVGLKLAHEKNYVHVCKHICCFGTQVTVIMCVFVGYYKHLDYILQ